MLCFGEGNECLVSEVVLEGNCFYVFLDAARDLSLVTPGIYALEVWSYGGEEVGYLGLAGFVLFRDGGGDGGVEGADSVEGGFVSDGIGVRSLMGQLPL